MPDKPILIVDDEKNIRLTLSQTLESLGLPVRTAVNGEEALARMEKEDYGIVFLDLKMPGMDGMEVLARVRRRWPGVRVIIITAHGTIDSAVEAMKLGAVDFIQKPFSPKEIRGLVQDVLEREALDQQAAGGYGVMIQLAKRHISDRKFDKARETAMKAVGEDPGQAEAYNLLGALAEIRGDVNEAQRYYRAALDMDPGYKPAWANLDRSTSWEKSGGIDLGSDRKDRGRPGEAGEGAKDEG